MTETQEETQHEHGPGNVDEPGVQRWVRELRMHVSTTLNDFLRDRSREVIATAPETAGFVERVIEFLDGGKYLRPTFAYLGWLSRAEPSAPAVRAASSLELLHAFALIQDDVMDGSSQRRGRPAMHLSLATERRANGLMDDADRFGESAATLLGDLCMMWSEQLLRTSGLPHEALDRAWSYYDALRQELAIGQYLDLHQAGRNQRSYAEVMRVARLKSGSYTVTGPLVLGARLAGADGAVQHALTRYGGAIGTAFQLRDDVLGLYGDPAVTGKPVSDDLRDRKTTTLIALASELADTAQHRELRELLDRASTEPDTAERVRQLISETGSLDELETRIATLVEEGTRAIDIPAIPGHIRTRLLRMAHATTNRHQ